MDRLKGNGKTENLKRPERPGGWVAGNRQKNKITTITDTWGGGWGGAAAAAPPPPNGSLRLLERPGGGWPAAAKKNKN